MDVLFRIFLIRHARLSNCGIFVFKFQQKFHLKEKFKRKRIFKSTSSNGKYGKEFKIKCFSKKKLKYKFLNVDASNCSFSNLKLKALLFGHVFRSSI